MKMRIMEKGNYSFHTMEEREKNLNMLKKEIMLMEDGRFNIPQTYDDGDREMVTFLPITKECVLRGIDALLANVNNHLTCNIQISCELGNIVMNTDDTFKVFENLRHLMSASPKNPKQ